MESLSPRACSKMLWKTESAREKMASRNTRVPTFFQIAMLSYLDGSCLQKLHSEAIRWHWHSDHAS